MNVKCAIIVITLWCVNNITSEDETITPALILTPLINQNRTEEARNQSIVDPNLFLNVTSHSGFLTVDEDYGSHMFFWYFPIANKPVNETEWIIWLPGGPGETSLLSTFGHIGPFEYMKNDGTIKLRDISWAQNYSILFIDNPVGSGFSFTNSEDGFIRKIDKCADQLYNTVQQFLKIFPELRKAPLYIAGGSYAGRFVPALAKKIMDNQPFTDYAINLQGLILSSPTLDRDDLINYTSIFYQWGLIDSQGVLAMKEFQDAFSEAVLRGDHEDAFEKRDELLSELEYIAMHYNLYNLLEKPRDTSSFVEYIVRPSVSEALHVGNILFTFSNSSVYRNLKYDSLFKASPIIEALLEKYRVLIYCGQLDLIIPCVPNMQVRRNYWNWSGRNDFILASRIPWWFNDTVAGYVKRGGQLTEVLVRGAGHSPHAEKPAQVHQLITSFIKERRLPIPPRYDLPWEYSPKYTYDIIADQEMLKTTESSNSIELKCSLALNLLLVICIIAGVFYFVKWRRKYKTSCATNDATHDGVLSLDSIEK